MAYFLTMLSSVHNAEPDLSEFFTIITSYKYYIGSEHLSETAVYFIEQNKMWHKNQWGGGDWNIDWIGNKQAASQHQDQDLLSSG